MTEPRVTLHLLNTGTAEYVTQRTWQRKTVALDKYEVRLDGMRVGTVERAMVTREAPRARGSRISNGRWSSPAWIPDGRRFAERPSRVEAVAYVLDGVLIGYVDGKRLCRLEAERAVVVKG